MIWLLAALAALFIASRKAGEPAGTPSPGQTSIEAAAGYQQAAGSGSPVAQQIQQQHQQGFALSGVAGSSAASAAALAGWTAATATGIGAIVVGAVILFDLLRGTAHLTANDFVNRFQNPFRADLGELIDPHDARMAAGTETLGQAQSTYDAIAFLWEQFQIAANRYAEQSNDAAPVVRQAFDTLNGPNGMPGFPQGFINFMLQKLTGEIQQLAGGNPLSVFTGTF